MDTEPQWLSSHKAMEELHCRPSKFFRLLREGKLRDVVKDDGGRLRIPRSAIEQFKKEHWQKRGTV